MKKTLAGLASSLVACGATPGPVAPVATYEPESTSVVAGMAVVVLPRSTPGHVHLSLWIDAGSRDGDPAVATLAAWLMERAAGAEDTGAEATTTPDGIEIALPCASAELDRCLRALAVAMSVRLVAEAEMAGLLRRFHRAQGVVAADLERAADRLALEALFGPDAAAFDPLAAIGETLTAESVSDFLREHIGRDRAMLIAVGDARASSFEGAVEETFGRAPTAASAKSERSLPPPRGRGVAAQVGDQGLISAATVVASESVARALLASTDTLSASAFPVRGGVLVFARRAPVSSPDLHVDELVTSIERFHLEGGPSVEDTVPWQPSSLATCIGAGWVSGGPVSEVSNETGIGAVLAGERHGRVRDPDPDAAMRDDAVARLLQVKAAAVLRERSVPRGTIGDQVASVVTDNGARIEVRRRPNDTTTAFVVLFAGGATGETSALHGRSALLATLMSTACETSSADELQLALTPIVRADAWGFVVRAPPRYWSEALDLAVRCAQNPDLSSVPFETARERLVHVLSNRSDSGLRASAAALFAPATPGWIAPVGNRTSVSTLSPAVVRELFDDNCVAARTAIAVVGSVPVSDVVARLSRRVARLPPGRVVRQTAPRFQTESLVAVEGTEPIAQVVIGWRIDAEPQRAPDTTGARAFAGGVSRALSLDGRVRVIGAQADAGTWGAWAAVLIEGPESILAVLPQIVTETMRENLEAALIATLRAQAQEAAMHQADPATVAVDVAYTRLHFSRALEPAAHVAERLAAATPQFLVARPVGQRPTR